MAHRRRSILPVTRTSNKIVVPAATPPVTIATPSTETTTPRLATDTVTTPSTAPNAAISDTAAAVSTPPTTTTARAPRAPRRPDPKHSMRRRSAVPLLLRLGLAMTSAAAESSAVSDSASSTNTASSTKSGGSPGAEEVTLVEGVPACGAENGRNDAENDSEGVSGVQRACDIEVRSPAKGDDAAEVIPRLEDACDDAKPIDEDDAKPIDINDTKPVDFHNDAKPDHFHNDAKPSWKSALVADDEAARWTRLIIGAACDEVRTAVESGESEDVKGVIERGASGTRKRRCPWQPFALPRPSSAPCA